MTKHKIEGISYLGKNRNAVLVCSCGWMRIEKNAADKTKAVRASYRKHKNHS